MLVLTRKPGEKLIIGDNIIVTVVKVQGNTVRIAIEAPSDVRILRSELLCELDVNDTDLRSKPREWKKAESSIVNPPLAQI